MPPWFRVVVGTLVASGVLLVVGRGRTRLVVTDSSSRRSSPAGMMLEHGILSFGSCTAYDLRDWPIFTDAIVPAEPDAWVWVGDMVYLDEPDQLCGTPSAATAWQAACNCTPSYIHTPPYSCHAGDVEYARQRWESALQNAPYNVFLDYMCPASRALGYYPPPGTNPAMCPHAILGIYDDHDFGWNNGNRRLPHKEVYKSMYLDAIGESSDSPRRGAGKGAWAKYTFNADKGDAAVDVFLLDERFDRDPLPCDTRRAYCEEVVLPDKSGAHRHDRAFCEDFLSAGGCCEKDEAIFHGWCREPASAASPLWHEACDVSFANFGQRALRLNPASGDLEVAVGGSSNGDGSPICEVLGRSQRRWLRAAVAASTAAVKVFVSPSVLLANPVPTKCGTREKTRKTEAAARGPVAFAASGLDGHLLEVARGAGVRSELGQRLGTNASVAMMDGDGDGDGWEDVFCRCGGDDLDCYSAAQQELLYLIAGPGSTGCAVVLTGDFHWSDVKVLRPGTPAASAYSPAPHPVTGEPLFALVRPVPQLMASGLTSSTGSNVSCDGFALDPLSLRVHPECAFVRGPSYGRLVFEYEAATIDTSAVGDDDGDDVGAGAAPCADGAKVTATCAAAIKSLALQVLGGAANEDVRLETVLDTSTCSPL